MATQFVIEYETASGEVDELGGIFPTIADAERVCEEVWNRYAPSEKFARFSVLNSETREVISELEC